MGVEKRDDDTAVVIPTSSGREKGRDPCPARRQHLWKQSPIPDDEWIYAEITDEGEGPVEECGLVLKTRDPSPDEMTDEWIYTDAAKNARDHR